jgi:F0F1-type ATP synthase assembly protein I
MLHKCESTVNERSRRRAGTVRSREVDVDDGRRGEFSKGLRRSSGSYELVFSSALLALIGFGLDRWLGTGPVLVILFAVAGFAGASIRLYFGYKYEMERQEEGAPWTAR